MPLSTKQTETLLTAVLAVNSYSTAKVTTLLPAMRELGLTTPATVASRQIGELMPKLFSSGYDRGMLTEMMTKRLLSLMQAIHTGKLDDLVKYINFGDKVSATKLLCQINGVGPTVANTAWTLLTTKD